ncbi:MAG: PHP domain-containing protein [Chloroflexota bacterium]|nr:PHP domain-containing protein [Chloroflexota bacterium]
MKLYRAELHVHTVLSPCAGVEMIPPLIVREALSQGLNLIAITDHNASENVAAVITAASDEDLTVLPGMELQTEEEIHSICLFDTLDQLQALQDIVDETLPDVPNEIEFFGEQFVVDETGDFIRRKERLLINSTRLSLEEAFQAVTDLGGLFIPAHVNREAFGLIYHLGFVPPNLDLTAIEISRHISPEDAVQKYPQLANYPLMQSGDVHYLSDFLGINRFEMADASVSELKKAFLGLEGRRFWLKTAFDDSLP